MAFNIGSIVGFVKIDHSGVKTGMTAAEREVKAGMDRTGAAADRGGKDAGKRFGSGVVGSVGSSLKTLGAAVAGAFAVDRVVQFIGASIDAASQLEQSVGGVNAVFGQYAEKVHSASKSAAQDLGLSTNAYNELVTVSGAMLKNKGLSDFAAQSQTLVKIGADLAAQFGGPTSQAVEALNAAMRGESDPIERYGISLNEAAVNAKMAEMGLTGLEGAALDQAKTQARLALITDQSSDALGAFGREADTAAGKQQRLAAEWENQQAALGQKLLPAMVAVTDFASNTLVPAFSGMVEIISGLASAFGGLPGPVKAAVTALVVFHLLKGPMSTMLDTTRTKIDALGKSLKGGSIVGGAKAAGSALLGMLGGPWGIAIAGATTAVALFAQAQQNAKGDVDALKESIDKQTGAFTELSRKRVAEKIGFDVSKEDLDALDAVGVSMTGILDATLASDEAYQKWRGEMMRVRDAHPELAAAIEGVMNATEFQHRASREAADQMANTKKLMGETGTEAEGAAPKVENLADKTAELKTKSEEAAQKQKDLAEAILEVSDAAVDADKAEADWQEAIDNVTKSIEENGRTATRNKKALDLNTEAGRNNQDALIGLRDAAMDNAEAMLTQGDGVDRVKSKMKDAREEFIEQARKMGLSKTAAEALATQYGLTEGSVDDLNTAIGETPKEKTTKFRADIQDAQLQIAALQRKINLLDKRIDITTYFHRVGDPSWQAAKNRSAIDDIRNNAEGGYQSGPGTGTSDSILSWLSDGEYVVRAAAVDKYGRDFFDRINAMRFAGGGFVSTAAVAHRSAPALEAGNRGAQLQVAGKGSGMDAERFEVLFMRLIAELRRNPLRASLTTGQLNSAMGAMLK